MSCSHRRSVRFPQVFRSVTVDQGVRELLQQGPLESIERSTPTGFGTVRGDRENRDVSSTHKRTYNCQHHRSLRGTSKPSPAPTSDCRERHLQCRHSGLCEHIQYVFESDIGMDCGDGARSGVNRSPFDQLAGPQNHSGQVPAKEVSSRFEDDAATSSPTHEHFVDPVSAGAASGGSGKEDAGNLNLADSCFDPQPTVTARTPLQSTHCHHCRTSHGSLSPGSANAFRQIEDDDSIAGDFNCHHFLDNDSRQRWNLQHGVKELVRYCWANGPGSNPSPGPVSSSCSDLAAHLATIDRLHDQYLESFRWKGGGVGQQSPHADGFTEDKDRIRRMRLVYNCRFIAGSSPRERRGQGRGRGHRTTSTDRD